MAHKKRALPCPLPDGWILRDTEKREWRLGRIIGRGGFGLIYLASDCVDTPVREDTDYVIKVEYHENGPLFSELKFYQRVAKPDSIRKWKRNKGIDFLGIPTYWGSGLSEHNGTRYRFMVMDRLGSDLQKIFVQNGERLKKETVLQLGYLMVDVLEYIHSNEYVHADIKAANLLLGHRDPDKVYLADYGLSYRYFPNGMHKEYKENPRKGHNGTIEYTSIDAHKGVAPSRRGDLEVLGYCLLHWQCGTLPWLSMLRNPGQVQDAKAKLMDSLPDSVIQLSTDRSTLEVAQFLLSIRTLDYEEQPDYEALRKVLSVTMHQGPLDFSRPSAAESARLATNRYPNQARSAGKPARPVLVNEDEAESFAKTRYKTRGPSKTKQQKPYKGNSTAERYATSRPLFLECGDDDEVDALPQRAHTKAKEGPKQRKRSDQPSVVHGLRRTDKAWLPVRKQQHPLGLHHSFVPDISDHWRRNCRSWGDTRRGSEEEVDYWEHPRDNCWEDMDYNGHQYGADVYNEDQYTYTNRNGAVESSNKPFLQWFFEICAGIVIVLMLRMIYVHYSLNRNI